MFHNYASIDSNGNIKNKDVNSTPSKLFLLSIIRCCLLIYVLEGKNMKLSIEGTSGEIKELLQANQGSEEHGFLIIDYQKIGSHLNEAIHDIHVNNEV